MNRIISLYSQGKSIRQLAKELHRSEDTIGKILKINNIKIRQYQKNVDKDLLIKKYCQEKKTTYKVAEEIGISQSTVRYWLITCGIKKRGRIDYPSPTKGKKGQTLL